MKKFYRIIVIIIVVIVAIVSFAMYNYNIKGK